jgi:hypothetical protein
MHFSKNTLYVGIISYCVAVLFFWDWPAMTDTIGTTSALWLGKMLVDIGFAAVAFIRLMGPALFSDEDDDGDDVSLHASDMAVPDTMLFGLFLVNILANGGYHGYLTVMTTGASSFWYSIWFLVEAVAFFLTWVLFAHARASARKAAAKAKAERKPSKA